MKWVTYEAPSIVGARSGILEGDVICEVEGGPFSEFVRTNRRVPLDQARLLAPLVPAVPSFPLIPFDPVLLPFEPGRIGGPPGPPLKLPEP